MPFWIKQRRLEHVQPFYYLRRESAEQIRATVGGFAAPSKVLSPALFGLDIIESSRVLDLNPPNN